VPAFAACYLAVLSLGAILAFLPESLTEERKVELAGKAKEPLISLPATLGMLRRPRFGPLLTVRLIVSLAGSLFMALFMLWAWIVLGWTRGSPPA
jgi:hypothetical protein